ncbi:putative transcription factor Hap3/NF-YB family [Rosa chinensis]|uniref:Histone H2A n=1 Tax=Rosa chinensis TaxID=74649 RepID=A0A2P6R074_ROSCH|nr:putative transcription factor Hap3/NF-YB family [Rosa chinensis]
MAFLSPGSCDRSFLQIQLQRQPKATKSVSRSSKAGLQFPFGCIACFLKSDKYAERVGAGALVYLFAVLEYLAASYLGWVRTNWVCNVSKFGCLEEIGLVCNLGKPVMLLSYFRFQLPSYCFHSLSKFVISEKPFGISKGNTSLLVSLNSQNKITTFLTSVLPSELTQFVFLLFYYNFILNLDTFHDRTALKCPKFAFFYSDA